MNKKFNQLQEKQNNLINKNEIEQRNYQKNFQNLPISRSSYNQNSYSSISPVLNTGQFIVREL